MTSLPHVAPASRHPLDPSLPGAPAVRRLALIVGQLGLGGAEQQLYHLLSGLDRQRFQPAVVSLGSRAEEFWTEPIRRLGVPLWHVPRRLGRLARAVRIARLLRGHRVQLVHGWVLHANVYAAVAGRLARVPVRLGSMREHFEGVPQGRMLRLLAWRGLDALVTNSQTAADDVRRHRLTRTRVHVVHNGVPIPPRSGLADRARLKLELGFGAHEPLIGTIGRLDPNKNHALLLRAFASLMESIPQARLVILGDGPLRSELRLQARTLGLAHATRFPGAVPHASRFLPALDVCCLTSRTEGLPNLVMEAAAAGVPVVSTRCGGSVELIDPGVDGFLVTDNDPSDLSSCLSALLADPERRLRIGTAARERMRHQFGLERMVERMTGVYDAAWEAKCAS